MRHLPIGFACLAWLGMVVGAAQAQRLEYDFKQEQKASYQYDIEVDNAFQIVAYTGVVHYQVMVANDQLVRLSFQGGLNEQFKPHPDFPQGSRLPTPKQNVVASVFGRYSFAGKRSSRNQFSMTRTGQILSLDAQSQLPYLLGNLSLLPFETLPKGEKKTWRSEAGASISDASEELGFSMRPFGPLGFQTSDRMLAAAEVARYKILGIEDGIVNVEKTYELKTPDTGDRESFQMTGMGTWKWDTKDHFPYATEMKYRLSIKEGNTTTTIPISVKFTKLTEERLAAMREEAKLEREKAEKARAEHMAVVSAPIEEEELSELIANLESKEGHKKHGALIKLMQREIPKPDPRLVENVRKLAGSSEIYANLADTLLERWDPIHRLNKAYAGAGSVETTDLMVDASTELYVGQIVQIREHGRAWYPAEINEILSNGRVKVKYRGWPNREASVLRNQIQLAPQDVRQPARTDPVGVASVSVPVPTQEARTWSDSSGSFQVEAIYLGVVDEKVVLKTKEGREISVPMSRLSLADQRFVAQLQEEAKKLGNPFDKE